jgi:hypothetical protein
MTHSLAGNPPRRLLLAILVGTALLLSAMSISFADSARADWVCSETGGKPWVHADHYFAWLEDYEHRYMSGHTHTNGEHHHIWRTYRNYGYIYVGETHDNCGI